MLNIKDALYSGIHTVQENAKKINETVAPGIVHGIETAATKTGDALTAGKNTVVNTGVAAKDAVMDQLDANHDGKVDIEDIIILGLRTPGVKVERNRFLANEFRAHYDAVSGISAALGAPGGVAMAATIPTDIMQYYGYTLRAAQELMYLYGFPEIISADNEAQIDTSTMNTLIIAMGVMFGVAGANNAIKAMAKALGEGVERQLMKKALTKGAIYPIVKSIAKWFGVKMTKEVFSGFFKKAIPVAGGIIGGGITYVSFKPCCERLKTSLMDTMLSNPNHLETKEESEIFESIAREIDEQSEEHSGF